MTTALFRIGTRGSRLALVQAREVRDRLIAAHDLDPKSVVISTILTSGDRIRDRPLAEIGGKGLFIKEIEEALLSRKIDLAVHSMKDMPALLPPGLVIAGLLKREDPRDAFVSYQTDSIASLRKGAVVGSSSVRRAAQLRALRPDFEIVQFRGNVDTRLAKLARGEVDATILACAGLNRLGIANEITAPIAPEIMLPAVAQGAIGIETRASDTHMRDLLSPINDAATERQVAAERAFLIALDGSCRTPLAGHAVLKGLRLSFRGMALTMDGSAIFEAARRGGPAEAETMGRDAAEEVRRLAGDRLMT
ncbi:MAG: hydroxymethylbilane synthase [Parvibaculaceae bacterium]